MRIILFILFFPFTSISQEKDWRDIKSEVDQINSLNLDSTVFTWEQLEEYFDHGLDGGAEIIVYQDSSGLRKFKYSLGLSYGMLTVIMYLTDNEVISVTEIEENFELNGDQKEIVEVYRINLYVTNFHKGASVNTYTGKRKMSSWRANIDQYESELQLVRKVLMQE